VRTPLFLRARNANDFIPTGIHPRELNLNWLSKLNVNSVSTEIALVQRNAELEKKNEQLSKELLDQKLLLLEYKTFYCLNTRPLQNLIRSNEEFKRDMKEQAEETNRMMK